MSENRFGGTISDIYSEPACILCKWNKVPGYEKTARRMTCPAFPDGIPDEILTGEHQHQNKYPGQKNDIVFDYTDSYKKAVGID